VVLVSAQATATATSSAVAVISDDEELVSSYCITIPGIGRGTIDPCIGFFKPDYIHRRPGARREPLDLPLPPFARWRRGQPPTPARGAGGHGRRQVKKCGVDGIWAVF